VYAGQILVESTKEPLFDACRALVALGHAGRLEMWGGESCPRMIVRDIEQAAKLTVVENVNARAHVDADVVSPHGRTLTDSRPHGNHLSVTKH
jgi:hypothetical protein